MFEPHVRELSKHDIEKFHNGSCFRIINLKTVNVWTNPDNDAIIRKLKTILPIHLQQDRD